MTGDRDGWLTRRTALRAGGAGLATALAGCATDGPDGTPERADTAADVPSGRPERVTLVAGQLSVGPERLTDEATYRTAVGDLLARADESVGLGPDALVALPEDVGLLTVLFGKADLLSEAPSLAGAIERYVRRNLPRVGWKRLSEGASWARAVLLAHQDRMAETYFDLYPSLAREYGVYLVAGSGAFTDATLAEHVPADAPGAPSRPADDRRVYNVSVVFAPDGRAIGVQRKVRLIDLEGPDGLDLVPAPVDRLRVVPTRLGALGVLVCFDAFHDGPLDAVESRGADVLVQPAANPVEWVPWQQRDWLRGSPTAVEERSFTYAVNPMLNGRVLDLLFAGQSSVSAAPALAADLRDGGPLGYPATDPHPSFVSLADGPRSNEFVAADLPHPDRV